MVLCILPSQFIKSTSVLFFEVFSPKKESSYESVNCTAREIANLKLAFMSVTYGACYPEGHPESTNMKEDLCHLKEKVDAECDFLATQMFFDNNIFYNFLYRAREEGISVPIIAAIMPITNIRQVKRTLSLSGTYL